MANETYVLICPNGHRNKRRYLPQYFLCHKCGESWYTANYEILADGKVMEIHPEKKGSP